MSSKNTPVPKPTKPSKPAPTGNPGTKDSTTRPTPTGNPGTRGGKGK